MGIAPCTGVGPWLRALRSAAGDLPGHRVHCSDLGVHHADPGVHHPDLGVHDAPIFPFTIVRSARSRSAETRTKLVVKRDGSRYVSETTADEVLIEGLEWIAEQVLRHGFVKPEYA